MPKYLSEVADVMLWPSLSCPLDTWNGGANASASKMIGTPVSYFFLSPIQEFRSDMQQVDPNHGIAYCVLHGEKWGPSSEDPAMSTKGTVLRLLKDGSIHSEQVGFYCYSTRPTGNMVTRPPWPMLTDAPCPTKWCLGVPCSDPLSDSN